MRARGLHRDRWGVPHLVGDDVLDLALLQGRATATDRAWQLDHARRRASGRTAEILGPSAVEWDALARRADLDHLARRAYACTTPEDQAFVASYVDGVNEVLPEARCPELDFLDLTASPWEPWTPLAVLAAQHLLFATFPSKLWRRHLRRVLGSTGAAVLRDEGLDVSGSNSWVVGGARTRTGRPLLAGDPHRSFTDPNVYVQVRLTCPAEGIDVAGFTFAGVPGVQHFAHAGGVAWGITNAMGDYQDVYVEELRTRDGVVECREAEGWREAAVRTELVEVRDADPVSVVCLRTSRGPVVVEDAHGTSFSLRRPSDVLGDLGFGCLLPLLRARTADDVVAALDGWVEPVNNLVAADTAGEIRQQVVGLVPRRDDLNRWEPVQAWVPRHAWAGWVELPGRHVAPHEHLVTANHRMPGFEEIGTDFAPPARADRIDALLSGRSDLSVADCSGIHADVLAGQPAHLHLALCALDGLDGPAEQLRRDLATWGQRFDAGSRLAAAYVGVRDAFVRRVSCSPALAGLDPSPYPELLAAWTSVEVQVYLSLGAVLSDEALELLPDRDALLRAAVEEVSSSPVPAWGERHRYEPPHALDHLGFSAVSAPGPHLAGDNDCVRCAGQVPGDDVALRGSIARYAWDLAGLDTSGWIVPMGVDGRPGHPHRADQLPMWAEASLVGVTGMELVTPVVDTSPAVAPDLRLP